MTKKINHQTRAADLLEAAAAVIEERGWGKGNLINAEGHVCAVGALNVACNNDAEGFSRAVAYDVALAALAERAPADAHSSKNSIASPRQRAEQTIFAWNDVFASEADIREGFLLAAKDLRNKAVPG